MTGGSSATPAKIGDGFATVAASGGASIGLKSDGSLWSWGKNGFANLGNGQIGGSSNIPQQIGLGYGFINAGPNLLAAVKTDGTLWIWGYSTWTGAKGNYYLKAPTKVEVGSASKTSFSAEVDTVGSTPLLTLSISAAPGLEHRESGVAGTMFVIAVAPNGSIFSFTPTGWQALDMGNPVGWANSLQTRTSTLLTNANLSSLRGLAFFVGYGLGATPSVALHELMASQRYKLAYTVQ